MIFYENRKQNPAYFAYYGCCICYKLQFFQKKQMWLS